MDELTNQEFDLMDELYFIQSYEELKEALGWKDTDLQCTLKSLQEKEFVRLMVNHDQPYERKSRQIPWEKLYYLATKKGLMTHNGF